MSAKPEARHGDSEAEDYERNAPEEGPVSRHDILSEPLMHSTPQSKGITEQSELHYDMRTKTRENIENVKHDLRNTHTVDFANMMRAILFRENFPRDLKDASDTIPKKFEREKKEADADYDMTLGDAIELCNSDLTVPRKLNDRTSTQLLCQSIKANLKKYCEATTEKQRYVPLVNVLNTILSFKEKAPQVIFVVNDPMIVQSDRLPVKSKRKPDIIKVSLATFKGWLQLPDNTNFDDCKRLAATGKIKIVGKPYWIDVGQFWELKLGCTLADFVTKEKVKFHTETCSTKGLVPSDSTAVAADSSAPKRKREDDKQDAESRKRPRKQPMAAGGQIMPPLDEVLAVNDDVQCGYYAIERFRATWQITHVSGIFLKDNFLNLLWYDPQGCIKSSRIDIVRQLPLLVLLVKLQQRSDFWSGSRTPLPPQYRMEGKCAPRFQLVGRMTSCVDLTKEAGNLESDSAPRVSGAREANLYFKSSWPEDDRPKEADIIELAISRVRQHLPPAFQQFVLNHLPKVYHAVLFPGTSTGNIRQLLDLPTQGSRTQYLMFSKKLSSVRTIVHDTSFKRVLFEIIRAHRLLWVLGIAHGDVSFHNLMLDGDNGILNDFDLASIMEPGETSPSKTGHRRTGTSMFMPIELLSSAGVEGLVPRVYRHELESFAWVLLYATLCVVNGEENLNAVPFRDWVRLTSTDLGSRKTAFLARWGFHIRALVKGPNQRVLLSTFRIWRDLLNEQEDSYEYQTAPYLPSDESLLTQVLAALDFPRDEWIEFKISSKDTPLMMPTSTGSTTIVEGLVEGPSSTSALPVVGETVAGGSDQSQGADNHDDFYD